MTEPPSWQPPTGGQPPPPPPPYGAPQYGAPQYGAPQYGAPQYGAPPGYGTPGYGNPTYQPGYQPYPMMAPKPGIIPLRPLAVGEILDGAFATIRRHPKAVLGLSATVACVQQALVLLVQAGTGTLTQSAPLGSSSGSSVGAVYTGLGGIYFVAALATALLTGLLCLIVSDSILGQPTSVRSAWARLRPLAWRLILVSFVATLLEYLGLIPCFTVGIWLWGIWALVVPALVLERTTFRGAFSRSRTLVRGSFWRVWGIRALGYIVASVLKSFAGLATAGSVFFSVLSHPDQTTAVHVSPFAIALGAVLTIIATTLTAPFLAGMDTLLYVDRRIRVEALDVQLQQAAATAAPTFG